MVRTIARFFSLFLGGSFLKRKIKIKNIYVIPRPSLWPLPRTPAQMSYFLVPGGLGRRGERARHKGAATLSCDGS